jgi:hypothetical protein
MRAVSRNLQRKADSVTQQRAAPPHRSKSRSAVPLVPRVCATCGFTEESVDTQADLAKIRHKYRISTAHQT